MSHLRPFYSVIRLAVTCLLLAIGLRTWLVMGLIEPINVAGSSMAPTLRGDFVTAHCPDCQHTFSVGIEATLNSTNVLCPQCTNRNVALNQLPPHRGDRLWIDRTVWHWREPRRWELVVAHQPDNYELCVKRIVGLPGETLSLQNGNVLVNDKVAVKALEEQRRLRQPIHREKLKAQRWQPQSSSVWQYDQGIWNHHANQALSIAWLEYQHPQSQPITDDVPYNAKISRQLNLVNEFMLSTEIALQGDGILHFRLNDGTTMAHFRVQFPKGQLIYAINSKPCKTARLSPLSLQQLIAGQALLEVSNFDKQLLVAINGHVELKIPWPNAAAAEVAHPFAIGAQDLAICLKHLSVYRDLYHANQAANLPPQLATSWQLGPNEYFLLGDNSPVSLDSRSWGPVPRPLFVGKPLR